MGYARQHLEAQQPGAVAMFLTGMGADSDPAPRGQLLHAKRHGLELAGAVVGVLDRPMRPVRGPCKLAYDEIELPLATPPTRERLEQDSQSQDRHLKDRADNYLKLLNGGQRCRSRSRCRSQRWRLGEDLTFLLVGGRWWWTTPGGLNACWPTTILAHRLRIPRALLHPVRASAQGGRLRKRSSLIYYGFYGPLRTTSEDLLVNRMVELVSSLRDSPRDR